MSCLPPLFVVNHWTFVEGVERKYIVLFAGAYDAVMHTEEYCLGASFQQRMLKNVRLGTIKWALLII